MKGFKKLLTGILAATLIMGSSLTAFAEETTAASTYDITITENEKIEGERQFEAYQIFKGEIAQNENGENVLSNVEWGANISDAGKAALATGLNELKKLTGDAALKADDPASKFADVMGTINSQFDSAEAQKLAEILGATNEEGTAYTVLSGTPSEITGLSAGFYFVANKLGSMDGKENGAYTRYIIGLVSDINVAEKADVPQIIKKVDDVNDSFVTEDAEAWQDTADYDIGDDVPFKITATTATKVSDYKTYHLTIQDVQSAGLDAPEKFSIKVLDTTLEVNNTVGQTATGSAQGTSIKAEVVAVEGKTFAIKVTFTNATDATAKIPAAVNGKDVVVTYTSKLNENAVIGRPGNDNKVDMVYSNNPNSEDDKEEGKTPEDRVVVFTYKLTVDKIKDDGDVLEGAGFTLYKLNSKTGEYEAIGEELTGEALTRFEWKGLDDGQYKIVETTTPAGFNTIDPIEFKLDATHTQDPATLDLGSLTLTSIVGAEAFSANADAGTINRVKEGETYANASGEAYGEIVNKSGVTLPSTGGIGTTIFYIVGGLLIVAAAVFFVVRRKGDAE